jgi:hypothetical protein
VLGDSSLTSIYVYRLTGIISRCDSTTNQKELS